MAKKTVKETQPEAEPQPETEPIPWISYTDLVAARVHVKDEAGNEYYLDPARKQGEFVLRVVPKPAPETVESIPAEWIKPTEEEVKASNPAIDWGMKAEEPAETAAE